MVPYPLAGEQAAWVRFVHAYRGEQAGRGGEDGDDPDRGDQAPGAGDGSGQQGADREAAVAPQAVDPDGAGAPRGVGGVPDGGQEGGVHQRGADSEERLGGGPDAEGGSDGDQGDGRGLDQHAGGDQVLAAGPVGPPAGEQLPEAPHRRVERGQPTDLRDGQAVGGEQQGGDSPGQRVVEGVDHPRLAGNRQGLVADAGDPGDLAGGQLAAVVRVGAGGGGGGRRPGGLAGGRPRPARPTPHDPPPPRPPPRRGGAHAPGVGGVAA